MKKGSKASKKKAVTRKRTASSSRRIATTAGALVKPTRAIPPKTSLFLYTGASGRCEFDGCNKYLLEHGVTHTPGNFAEQAHIYAFKPDGPRGDATVRPADINDLSNLMLLCPECHHKVDVVSPKDFPVEVLRRFKQDHEERIYLLTGLAKDRDTVPLVMKGLVSGRSVDISDEEMQRAVTPNYLVRRQKVEIDLTAIPDHASDAYWQSARSSIDRKIDLLSRIEPREHRTLRVSAFALAPIPLLIYLGSKLSDKLTVDLYQRHRSPESWAWHEGLGEAEFLTRRLSEEGEEIALFVNVSGQNPPDDAVRHLDTCSVYELTLKDQVPTPAVVKTRADLERFTNEYLRAMAIIRAAHPSAKRIHLFPAVPAAVAMVLGRVRLPKVDPSLLVYDRDTRVGGFTVAFEVT